VRRLWVWGTHWSDDEVAAGAAALKNPSSQGLSALHRTSHFLIESWGEALVLVVVREVVYVVWQEPSTFCIPSSDALGCPVWSLCPSQALMVSGLLTGVSHMQSVPIPSTGWCLVSSLGCPTCRLCPSQALVGVWSPHWGVPHAGCAHPELLGWCPVS